MATYFRSTNRPLAVFTSPRSCIRRLRSQAGESAASAAPARQHAIARSSPHSRACRPCLAPLTPEIIEVEPVVRRDAAVVPEPLGIAQRQLIDSLATFGASRLLGQREPLDVNVIPVAAAV